MKRLLMDVTPKASRVALVEEGRLVEFQYEDREKKSLVGNIYVGRVMNVHKGMQACFVDIGTEKNAYLPLPKHHQVQAYGHVLVQVEKDASKQKGALVTQKISLSGPFLVLLLGEHNIGISQKITDTQERERIFAMAKALVPEGFGLIVRTGAAGKTEEDFAKELNRLLPLAQQILQKGQYEKAPSLVLDQGGLAMRAAKDLFLDDVESLVVNDKATYEQLQQSFPKRANEVELYDGAVGLMEAYFVESQIAKLLHKRVWLKSGGFLIIEQTEACVVIDVNTGKFTGKKNFQETVLKTNLEAAEEIALQLRLRNLSGMIIVDFIDMKEAAHRETLQRFLEDCVKKDRIKTTVVGMTELGLMQITRKKTSAPLSAQISYPCKYCQGTGLLPSDQLVIDQIYREVRSLFLQTIYNQVEIWSNAHLLESLKQSGVLSPLEEAYQKTVSFHEMPTGALSYYELKGKKN